MGWCRGRGGGLEPEDHLLCELLLTKLNAIADGQKERRIGEGRERKGREKRREVEEEERVPTAS